MTRSLSVLCLALAATLALPVAADPVSVSDARRQLYRIDRAEVVNVDLPGLTDQQVQTITGLAQSQRYYAALAYAPAVGVLAEATVIASNYHSTEAARAAAIAQCNERRSGGAACVIGLDVRPAGWEARALQLSAEATEAFDRRFRRTAQPRAFAVSPTSGAWGYSEDAASPEAARTQATERCAASKGDSDCLVVVLD